MLLKVTFWRLFREATFQQELVRINPNHPPALRFDLNSEHTHLSFGVNGYFSLEVDSYGLFIDGDSHKLHYYIGI